MPVYNKKDLTDINRIKIAKLKIKFDIIMLDGIIAFLYKESVLRTRKVLNNTYKLFNALDDRMYDNNIELSSRVWLIRTSLRARLAEGFENDNMIIQYCLDQEDCNEISEYILTHMDDNTKKISHEESKYIVKGIDDRLEYGYTVTLKEAFQEILDKIDDGDFKSYRAVSDDLYNISSSVINLKRNTNSLDSDETFSLRDDVLPTVVTDAVGRLKDRNKVFMTGIRRLNTILGPGYLSKRVYIYLAFPGGGKSQVLLRSALDIKKYNPHIKPKDPDKNPAVLLITMENDVDETIERMFNMAACPDDIRNYTPKQVIKKLKEDGELKITDKNSMDIIVKYYANRTIDTNDLYTIIKDLDDQGTEVIALILDYLKRIRPAEKADNEKGELKNVTNELKTLAKALDISIITAQQLNRTSASVVDSAVQAKKEDVTRLVGRDGIAGAWEIIENGDWVCIINQEVKLDTGELYLTFKMLKRRYRSSDDNEKLRRLDYFNHPYEAGNEIRLISDVDLPDSLSLYSLSSSFASLEETKRGKKNAVERKSNKNEDEFDPFDIEKVFN